VLRAVDAGMAKAPTGCRAPSNHIPQRSPGRHFQRGPRHHTPMPCPIGKPGSPIIAQCIRLQVACCGESQSPFMGFSLGSRLATHRRRTAHAAIDCYSGNTPTTLGFSFLPCPEFQPSAHGRAYHGPDPTAKRPRRSTIFDSEDKHGSLSDL